MHQALEAFVELDESTVGDQIDDLALHAAVDREAFVEVLPRRVFELLETERDLFFFAIDLEDHHFDFLSMLQHFAGVVDPAPRHIGDVQQSVDATEVDECTEVGNIRDGTGDLLAFVDLAQDGVSCFGTFLLLQLATADDDVASFFVNLEDDGANGAADELTQVGLSTDVHLRGGHEDRHANIDQEAALDLPDTKAFDLVAFVVVLENFFPTTDAVGFALGDVDFTTEVIDAFKEHFDFIAGGNLIPIFEFAAVHAAFALEAELDDDIVTGFADDRAGHEFAGGCGVGHFAAKDGIHHVVLFGVSEGFGELLFNIGINVANGGDQVVINHVVDLSPQW